MKTITIADRDINLLFDAGALEIGADVFGSMEDLHAAMKFPKERNRITDTIKFIVVLGNNAADAEGRPQDLTEGWVRHNLDVGTGIAEAIKAIVDVVAECYHRERVRADDEVKDAYLEEEKAKNSSRRGRSTRSA